MSFRKFLSFFCLGCGLLLIGGSACFYQLRAGLLERNSQILKAGEILDEPAGMKILASEPQFVARRARKKNTPPLIWIHGGPGRSENWVLPLHFQKLEEKFQITYWDQPGAGKSPLPTEGLSFELLQKSLEALMGRESEPIWLLGHDLGFLLALDAYQREPQKIAGLIGISPVFGLQTSLWRIRERLMNYAREQFNSRAYAQLDEIKLPLSPSEGVRIETWVSRLGGEIYNRDAWRTALYSTLWHPWYSLHEAFSLGDHLEESLIQLWPDLQSVDRIQTENITVPLLLILGEKDLKTDETELQSWLDEQTSSCQKLAVIKNSAHFPQIENPQEVELTLLGFPESCESAPKASSSAP